VVIRHIFPSKQKEVQAMINHARSNARIKKVFVFGSSATWDCGLFSDLDIAVEHDLKEPFEQIAAPFFKCAVGRVDIIEYNKIHDDLLKKNVENGVLVYEKPN